MTKHTPRRIHPGEIFPERYPGYVPGQIPREPFPGGPPAPPIPPTGRPPGYLGPPIPGKPPVTGPPVTRPPVTGPPVPFGDKSGFAPWPGRQLPPRPGEGGGTGPPILGGPPAPREGPPPTGKPLGYLGPPIKAPPTLPELFAGENLSPGIGQGWLTPFGENIPQLFQKIPDFIGGFGGGGGSLNVQRGIFNMIKSRGGFTDPNIAFYSPGLGGKGGAQTTIKDWWTGLIAKGQLRPETLFWLLGMMRGEERKGPWGGGAGSGPSPWPGGG